MKRSLSALAGACAAVTLAAVAASPAGADPNNINPIPVLNGTTGLPHLPGPTQAVFQLTGMASPNRTENSNVLGTDLGIMWDDGRGQMLTAFGDTAGLGMPNLLAGSMWAWRSNVLFRSPAGAAPTDGVRYTSFVDNPLPSPKIPGVEISFIPTAGVSVGGVQYMSMMSVREWGTDGHWDTNYSTLAVSGDDGQTWAQLPTTRRANEHGFQNFQQAAFVKADGYVYKFGTPSGRDNPGFVSRVKEADIANLDAYEYWDGGAWKPKDANLAKPIVGGVGELSVMWNQHLGQYVMLTTDPFNSVVLRTAPAPEGPWSQPRVLIDARDLPTAYAPMIYPYQTGSDLYFALGIHNQYNVVLMRTPL
ncbi:DUF4185 domain-containing protein [Nocardia transvalensis]|uniref:DUF4185 domain-containing protein n=1 Tax=Nocardia transvalensis TaxID=37333 RepID=UPI00189567D7|nr:DUF4185 domain-containing protein [Nocardia transvalensis]MBF6328996.1 DUF4185 domain-containing protein [Nocardia transvalensis]